MGIKNPRQFSLEFKRQAVQLAQELKSVTKTARQLGISEANIYSWRAQANAGALSGKTSGTPIVMSKLETSKDDELRRLQKEVIDLKKVNSILKQAAAFFSQDHSK